MMKSVAREAQLVIVTFAARQCACISTPSDHLISPAICVLQELQKQWERARNDEQSRGAGAADVRRWTGIRNIVEARELLRTLFVSACSQKAQVRTVTCGLASRIRPVVAACLTSSSCWGFLHAGMLVVANLLCAAACSTCEVCKCLECISDFNHRLLGRLSTLLVIRCTG